MFAILMMVPAVTASNMIDNKSTKVANKHITEAILRYLSRCIWLLLAFAKTLNKADIIESGVPIGLKNKTRIRLQIINGFAPVFFAAKLPTGI